MKNDALKKHHFWILLGVVPLFTLIGALIISSSVGGAISKREAKIKEANDKIAPKLQPKPDPLLREADLVFEKVSKKQGELHRVNWERQKNLFTWPAGSPLLKDIEALELSFGAQLPNQRGEFNEFQRNEVYLYEFSSLKKDGTGAKTGMADRIAPTQFNGGWQSVLRHVNDWGQENLTKDRVWLIMEDIWVQRSLLDAVRSVNEEMSAFHRAKIDKGEVVEDPTYDDTGSKIGKDGKAVPTPPEEKKKALFRNRTWAVELELVPEGTGTRVTGTLTNLSERLQLMGNGNVMTLNVWFTRSATEKATTLKIGGEFLPGKGATRRDAAGRDVPANVLPIVPTPDHVLPLGRTYDEIVRVEQVFDLRTVPIKRIDALVLGKNDATRGDAAALLPPLSPPFAADAAPAAAADAGGMGGAPPGPMAGGPGAPPPGPMGVGVGGPPGAMGGGGQGATKGQASGGGTVAAVIDGNKKRYAEVTAQVRRMPVGIVVVVDQSYMQDVLLAFANSPLRFQITQVTWTRFRGSLSGLGPTGGSSGPGGDFESGKGSINFGGSGDPDAGGRPRPGAPPGPGMPPGPPPPPGMGPSGMAPPGPGPMGPTGSSGSGSSIASESQITSGLVELSIYGIVSLYEKYVEPTAAPPAPGAPGAPVPPGPPAPAPGPAPMPMNPAPPGPKPRRRNK